MIFEEFLFNLFNNKKKKDAELNTFTIEKEPSTEITEDNIGGVNAYYYDFAVIPKTEEELIKTYREMSISPQIDIALTEIKNEVFIFDVPGKKALEISFNENTKISESLRTKIQKEFDNIYNILDFYNKGSDLFMNWYIDGRLYLHKIIDKNAIKEGIKKVAYIDSLRIKKIRKIPKPDTNGIYDINKIEDYYIFTPDLEEQKYIGKALEINKDAITYIDSGLSDKKENMIISYLHKAIIPYNNLKLMEESLLIYRVARSTERRVIYVGVGSLQKNKAEAYIQSLMNRFRNKLVYDTKTGSILDRKNVMSMLEDYWLPRQNGGKETEIQTLPGGDQLGIITDVDYFKKNLYNSLNVPTNRFLSDQNVPFIFGKSVEISREEYRFKKFIDRIRQKFIFIFEDLLKTQLLLKNIIVEKDWDDIRNDFYWVFTEDNAFVEYKEAEIINSRIMALGSIDPFTDKYLTRKWVQKNILKFTDEEIETINKEREEEEKERIEKQELYNQNQVNNDGEIQQNNQDGQQEE